MRPGSAFLLALRAWLTVDASEASGGSKLRARDARRAGAAGRFHHMPYANPDAPKGGRLVQGMLGTFDSLNPLIVRGLAVPGRFSGLCRRKPDGAGQ